MAGTIRLLAQFATGAAVPFLAATAFGTSLIFNNGAPNQLSGQEMTQYLQANQFTLTSGAVFGSITFWDADAAANFQGSIYWEICANSANNTPGTVLFSGLSTTVTHTATGKLVQNFSPEYISTVGLPSTTVFSGNYWLVLHNGPLSNNSYQAIFFETTTNSNPAPSYSDKAPFLGHWLSNDAPDQAHSQFAFQLYGIPQSLWPRITAITRSGVSPPKVSFTTASGSHYRVQYKNNITDPSWTTVSGADNIAGTGGIVPISDPDPNIATVKQRFYQVILL